MDKLKNFIRTNFIAGIITLAPIGATLYLLIFIFNLFDKMFAGLPEKVIGFKIPGLGAILGFIAILLCGILVKTYAARRVIRFTESILEKIPIMRAIYSAMKQFSELFTARKGMRGKPVVVEFPREGSFAIGFLLGNSSKTFKEGIGKDLVNIFVPTTPNPTSGYFIMVERGKVRDLNLSFEDAMKLIVSAGAAEVEKRKS